MHIKDQYEYDAGTMDGYLSDMGAATLRSMTGGAATLRSMTGGEAIGCGEVYAVFTGILRRMNYSSILEWLG